MFDVIAGSTERPLREQAPGSKVISIVIHAIVVGVVVGIPLLRVSNSLPNVPTLMAFVAAPPVALPLPPPPPRPSAQPPAARPAARTMTSPASAQAAPVDAPSALKAESTLRNNTETVAAGEGGVEGGVEGGGPDGPVDGMVGGLGPQPSPLPSPAPVRQAPVRIGGQLSAPALIHRVEPVFPDLAIATHETGVVILEAVVDTQGHVESVSILGQRHPLLDKAAINALKEWRYSPLILNGIPTSFVLTVIFNFRFSL